MGYKLDLHDLVISSTGPLESIDVFNGGRDYDVINPPSLEIENVSGILLLPILFYLVV